MSMKLKAMAKGSSQARLENAYMEKGSTIELKGVPCEITFEATGGFIEHESEQHDYLPVFHLIGEIKEVKGDFPYNVTSLYFGESEKSKLQKDIYYYPSPAELAHMITTGRYFSGDFQVPEVLGQNVYNFPAVLDLTIIPPPNQVAYEAATYDPLANATDEADHLNLPVFYVGFAGSGIDRKSDRLLDYYGIDLDDSYETYVLTAESSGYTDPPLMNYIEAPVVERQDVQQEDRSEYYITPEEEREMLDIAKQEEEQAQEQMSDEPYFHEPDMEEILIAQADRNIAKRLEDRRSKHLSSEKVAQDANEHAVKMEGKNKLGEEFIDSAQKDNTASHDDGMKHESDKTSKTLAQMILDDAKEDVAEQSREEEPIVPESESDEFLDLSLGEEETFSPDQPQEQKHPDIPQEAVDAAVNFNGNVNGDGDMKHDGKDVDDLIEGDANTLEDMAGADVSDARLQAKIDEKNALAKAKDVAREVQSDMADENDHSKDSKDKSSSDNKSSDKHNRDVTAEMQDVTDKYDAEFGDSKDDDDVSFS